MPATPAPPLTPLAKPRLGASIRDALVDLIDRQGLTAGDRLPAEAELARGLGVSRPTLRRAVRGLEADGVLSARPGHGGGLFVRTDLVPVTPPDGTEWTAEPAEALRVARRLLEPALLHLAADFASEGELDRIAYALQLMDRYQGSPDPWRRADYMFHRRVGLAAHNETLRQTANQLYRRLAPAGGPDPGRATAQRARQLAALVARDHAGLDAAAPSGR
jgi:GntR family transcriptional repressor for pyruvate dehydrogenase complex